MNPKILVGCPTYDSKAYCLSEYANAVKSLDYENYDILLVDNSEAKGYYEKIKSLGLEAWRLEEKGLPQNERLAFCRNVLRKLTLENYDYFLSLEQDIIPPKDIIKKLLSHSKKIVSAVYSIVMDNGKPMPLLWRFLEKEEMEGLVEKNPGLKYEIDGIKQNNPRFCKRFEMEELPQKRLIKIAACGLGAVLVHKDVFKKIMFRSRGGKEAYDDMFFCQDAFSKGFEIFADTGVICEHLGR